MLVRQPIQPHSTEGQPLVSNMTKHLIESITDGDYLSAEDMLRERLDIIKEQKLVEAKEVVAIEMFSLDEAGLAQATKIARELKKHPIRSRAFRLGMKLKRAGEKPVKADAKPEPKNDDRPKSYAPEIPPQTRHDGKRRASDVLDEPEDGKPKSKWERKKGETKDFFHSLQGKAPTDKDGKLKSPTGHILGKVLGGIAASIGE